MAGTPIARVLRAVCVDYDADAFRISVLQWPSKSRAVRKLHETLVVHVELVDLWVLCVGNGHLLLHPEVELIWVGER